MNPLLTKNYVADGAIAAHRIVTYGAAAGEVAQASANTDPVFGVTTSIAAADGERVDVIESGIAEVEYGGNVSRGDLLTTDASGKAVAAAPGAGTNARIVGEAKVGGVDGDIGEVKLVPSQIQG